MADKSGTLSEADRAAIANFINKKAKAPNDPCMVCGSVDTRVGDGLVGINAGGMGGQGLGVLLTVPIICHNCGFLRLFHAEVFGLIPPTKTDPPREGEV